MSDFKKGDFVRCIDNCVGCYPDELIAGTVHIIKEKSEYNLLVSGQFGIWESRHFVPYTPRVGDQIRIKRTNDLQIIGSTAYEAGTIRTTLDNLYIDTEYEPVCGAAPNEVDATPVKRVSTPEIVPPQTKEEIEKFIGTPAKSIDELFYLDRVAACRLACAPKADKPIVKPDPLAGWTMGDIAAAYNKTATNPKAIIMADMRAHVIEHLESRK